MSKDSIPISDRESVHMKDAPAGAQCDAHDWPSDGLGRRLVDAMRARYKTGGINVCKPCIERAREDARVKAEISKKECDAKAK